MWARIWAKIRYYFKHPLTWVLFVIVLTHIPILLEPLWYWDSGFYQVIAQGMANGKLLYVDLWDNKLPGIYFIFELFYVLFGREQIFLHLFLILWISATAVTVYKVAFALFNRKIAVAAGWVFAFLVAPPVCTGGIPNAEIFMILPNALAFLILLKNTKRITWLKALIAGLLLGVGFYFKMVAVFELAAIALILVFLAFKRKQFILLLFIAPLIAGFILPFGITTGYYYKLGYLNDFVSATLTHNAGYVESGNEAKYSAISILFSKLGQRLLATIVTTLIVYTLFVTKKIKRGTMIVTLWLAYALMGALFSGRDWNHYFVQVFPPASIFIGTLLRKIGPFIRAKRLCVKTAGIAWIVMSILLAVVFVGAMTTHNPVTYYGNFIKFVSGQRSKTDYDHNINWGIPTRDLVVEYLNNHMQPEETFFNYSSDAWLYAMTDRYPPTKYVVMYHLTTIEGAQALTMDALRASPPKYVVMYEYVEPFDDLFEFVEDQYTLEYTTGDAKLYRYIGD